MSKEKLVEKALRLLHKLYSVGDYRWIARGAEVPIKRKEYADLKAEWNVFVDTHPGIRNVLNNVEEQKIETKEISDAKAKN